MIKDEPDMYFIPDKETIPKYCCRKIVDKNSKISFHKYFNSECVYMQLLYEGCELINEYVTNNAQLQYCYISNDSRCENKDKVSTTAFKMWNSRGVCMHFKEYDKSSSFFTKYKEIRKNK